MGEKDIEEFTENVINTQQRLLANNYVKLSKEEILQLYKSMY